MKTIRKLRIGKLHLALILTLLLVGSGMGVWATRAETIPTITITNVVPGQTVTIQTQNYPAHQTFTVRMGQMGTRGEGGTVVGTLDSAAGGSISATFTIPDALKAEYQVAIRLDSSAGYYSFNWFYNVGSSPAPAPTPVPTPTPGGTGYNGIPTFIITAVSRDQTVTIAAHNFPPQQDFQVFMGQMGTMGVNGTAVTTTNTGKGDDFTATYTIPANLHGQPQIAIRLQSATGYYAFNWFYNNTTP